MSGGQEAFDAADTNQDGVVDATELAAAVAERNEATGADVDADEVLQSLDTDGDGLVSAASFPRAARRKRPGRPGRDVFRRGCCAGADCFEIRNVQDDGRGRHVIPAWKPVFRRGVGDPTRDCRAGRGSGRRSRRVRPGFPRRPGNTSRTCR